MSRSFSGGTKARESQMQASAKIAATMTANGRGENRSAYKAARLAGDELLLVSALAALLSLVAFLFFYRRGDILLWGDAVAHLNIARRLFDSLRPGSDQLGSVWLPLPHLLIAPFVASGWLWRSGVGGSIPSMAAYVVGVAGVFQLVRARASRSGAWLAAAVYALNPSLLYMQATAMTESIFLAALVWSVAYFDDFLRGLKEDDPVSASHAIERCGISLAAAIFTRYDGWILAFVIGLCVVAAMVARIRPFLANAGPDVAPSPQLVRRRLLRSTAGFLLLMALCPALWLAHNYKINRRPLDWLNGPYSAKAIERRSSHAGDPPYPGKDHPLAAAQYFLKAARMNTGEGIAEDWLISMAAAGVLIAALRPRRFGALLLLWLPLPFYAYSIAYGSVPIFVPEWWPFSYYNVRYGLELLPAIAVFAGLLPWAVSRLKRRWLSLATRGALFAAVIVAYASSAACASRLSRTHQFGHGWMIPVCYREAWVNSRDRLGLESQLAEVLAELPPNSTLLMYTSDHVGALQMAGVHFNRVISESAYFRWDAALSAPFAGADYIVAIGGDPVAEAVRIHPQGLTKLAILRTMGQPEVTVYGGSRP